MEIGLWAAIGKERVDRYPLSCPHHPYVCLCLSACNLAISRSMTYENPRRYMTKEARHRLLHPESNTF